MMLHIRRFLVLALITGLMSSPVLAAKSYYKWVDDEGVTHYTARKPNGVESEAINVSTGLPQDSSGQPIQLEDEATGQQQAAAKDPEANKDPERCEVARGNLKILNENARIRERDADGNISYLSEDEKSKRKKITEQAIAESC